MEPQGRLELLKLASRSQGLSGETDSREEQGHLKRERKEKRERYSVREKGWRQAEVINLAVVLNT